MNVSDIMDFKEIIDKVDKNTVFLGHQNNILLSIDIKKKPSVIITGETGSGKSILLDQVLLQLIKTHTSLEMGIMTIDTAGVELNYYADSKYALIGASNDNDKAIVVLSRVLKEIERRKALLFSNDVLTVDEYNKTAEDKLPLIVVAIDDDKFLLRNKDMEKMLSGIINQLPGLGIFFVMATSDVHNKFFESDKNTLATVLVSFDFTNASEALKANLDGADDLHIGEFISRIDDEEKIYNNFEFDDSYIEEIVNR